ncbi:MAG: PQQ-binding-like beta-propeller repeat protein [Thermoplasmatales archaeon]|nr:MAG: PQQ-binding-like beta-propeller repeat protein [Thermoplasmatales archaeon]
MKKIIVVICVIGLILMSLGVSVNAFDKNELSKVEGNTLITEFGGNQTISRVIEVDTDGNEVWNKSGLNVPQDAERLSNGNTLVTEYGGERVIEVNSDGHIVWQKTGLNAPVDAERLSNGNTLIAEFGANRVIEVDTDGNIVWQKTGVSSPFDAERLSNGNTLIAEAELYPDGRVIEVDTAGNIIWLKTELDGPVDIERLPNGNMLITEHVGKKVTEFGNGTIVWQKTGLLVPKDAERLSNGNTLITECGANRVIEVDSDGNNVWLKSGLRYPVDAERLPNLPPSVEIINPKEGYFHLRGMPLFPLLINTIVYGPINIKVNSTSATGIDRVEFYIGDKLKKTIDEEPYNFRWAPIRCGRYTIKVIAYDNTGQNASDEITVLKWRVHPVLILAGSLLMLRQIKHQVNRRLPLGINVL